MHNRYILYLVRFKYCLGHRMAMVADRSNYKVKDSDLIPGPGHFHMHSVMESDHKRLRLR